MQKWIWRDILQELRERLVQNWSDCLANWWWLQLRLSRYDGRLPSEQKLFRLDQLREQSVTPVIQKLQVNLGAKLYGTSLLRGPRDTAAIYLANFVMYIEHSLPGSLKELTTSGKLSREKTFANFAVLWLFAKVFSAKFWGPGVLGAAQASNPRKFSP